MHSSRYFLRRAPRLKVVSREKALPRSRVNSSLDRAQSLGPKNGASFSIESPGSTSLRQTTRRAALCGRRIRVKLPRCARRFDSKKNARHTTQSTSLMAAVSSRARRAGPCCRSSKRASKTWASGCRARTTHALTELDSGRVIQTWHLLFGDGGYRFREMVTPLAIYTNGTTEVSALPARAMM